MELTLSSLVYYFMHYVMILLCLKGIILQVGWEYFWIDRYHETMLYNLSERVNEEIRQYQWRNYVSLGEAAASGRQAAVGAAGFNQNYFVGL